MSSGELPSEKIVHDAVELYCDGLTQREFPSTQREQAEDAASFAILDSIMDGGERASIELTAELVLKLANQMKGKENGSKY